MRERESILVLNLALAEKEIQNICKIFTVLSAVIIFIFHCKSKFAKLSDIIADLFKSTRFSAKLHCNTQNIPTANEV